MRRNSRSSSATPGTVQGLGTRLLELLVQIGREEKLTRIIAHILPNNTAMQRVSRKCGFPYDTSRRTRNGSRRLSCEAAARHRPR